MSISAAELDTNSARVQNLTEFLLSAFLCNKI